MNYQRFSQLWDQVMSERSIAVENLAYPRLLEHTMSSRLSRFLIAFGRGEQWAIDENNHVKAAISKLRIVIPAICE